MKKRVPTSLLCWLSLFLLLLVGSSCNTKKILKPGEKLVKKNTISLNIPRKDANLRNLKYELSTLAKPVPNTRFIFLAREHFYYNPSDSTQSWRFLRKQIGEKPAIFNPELAENSAQDMKYYLGNKGFFDASVEYRLKKKGKHKVKIEYVVNSKNIYTIDTVIYKSGDQKIDRILQEISSESNLQKDGPVNLEVFNSEVQRVTKDLKDRGYFDFAANFIDTLRGDSTNNGVNIYFEVFKPKDQEEHQLYTVGKITVYPDYYPGDEKMNFPDSLVNGIHFRIADKTLSIKPQTISRSIFFRTGNLYSLSDVEKTNLQLSRLNNFRTFSVIPVKDSLEKGIVHFNIYLNPKKKLEMGLDWEFNNSNYTQTGDRTSLLGTSAGANFRNWNLFKNATRLDHSLKFGVELNLQQLTNPDSLIYSADLSYNFDLHFPKFVRWTGPYKLLDKIYLGKDKKTGERKKLIGNFYQQLRENAKSHWSINLSFRDISSLYRENSHNTSFGYELTPNSSNRFLINHTGFTLYFLVNETALFQSIIQQNPFLGLSTGNQLFSGLFFRNLSYTYTGKINPRGESWFFNNQFELSGHEVLLANKIYNAITDSTGPFTILNDFQFAQYAKLELDLRYYRKFKNEDAFAFRANVGVAKPFGFSTRVPYVQQFYLGGGNSMRAWKIRELGPGAYCDSSAINCRRVEVDTSRGIAFFQTGDLKIELNAEYRFNIAGDIDGAFFLDIGNIWSLDSKDARGGDSQFNLISGVNSSGDRTEGFINQFAIGSGFGIRWDFSYFVLRCDLGVKIRKPFLKRTEAGVALDSYWFPTVDPNRFRVFRDVNLNLAIGYPF